MRPMHVRNYPAVSKELQARAQELTQSQIARASGASPQAVCDAISGRRPPNATLIAWLGFELAYVPITRATGKRSSISSDEPKTPS